MQASGGIFHPSDPLDGKVGPSTGANVPGVTPVSSLTVDLVSTSQLGKPEPANTDTPQQPIAMAAPPLPSPVAPKTLTNPCEPSVPGGCDNINDDLIVSVNDVLENAPVGTRYVVHDMLGQGTFGQVFKCSTQDDGSGGGMVAVKVIKNQAAYYHQARVEIGVLQFLNTRGDPSDECHIVRLIDFFLHKNHLCLVFELLNLNLFELLRHNRFRGLSLPLVRVFLSQILKALAVLNRSNIIHCDIKPENILLTETTSGEVKLIDFGSACFSSRTVYTYIQSRFYRSPEVVLGHKYTMAVDMWSLGCVAAELFLGLPLFPAACELDLLQRILETVGPLPEYVLEQSKNTDKFFTSRDGHLHYQMAQSLQRLKTPEEFTESTGQKAPQGKQYFQHKALADIINAYPFRQGLSETEIRQESARRESFTDFLLGLLNVDPVKRWTPRQAQMHPFITGSTYTGPFQPIPDPNSTITTGTTTNIAVSTVEGIPMSIPTARVHASTTATTQTAPVAVQSAAVTVSAMDSIAAAVVASSPQMHAQAHAAAMAAVQMQMNLQQQGRAVPIYNDTTAAMPVGSMGGATSSSSPYIAAHSLQRIMDPSMPSPSGLLGTRTSAEGGESQWRVGSFSAGGHSSSLLPMSFFSPPSRSFGVHLQSMAPDQLPPPSFDPGYSASPHRIMPLMHLPAGGREQPDASPIPFQPSSVSTYRSTLAATAAGNYSTMVPSSRQQQYQQQQFNAGSSRSAARKEPLQRTSGFVVPGNASGGGGSGSGGLAEAMSSLPAAPATGVPGILGGDGVVVNNREESSPPEKQQQQQQQPEEELSNPDADWDPLWTDDVLTEEESFDHRSTGKKVHESSPPESGESAQIPSAINTGPSVPAPIKTSPKDTSLALAAQHLTQLQPLNPLGGASASWPIGALGVGVKNAALEVKTAGFPTAEPQSPQSPHGSGMEGISHAENMMWSPPRTAVLKSLPDGERPIGQQQQQQQPPPPLSAQLEPRQRLHGFVVSTDAEEEKDNDM